MEGIRRRTLVNPWSSPFLRVLFVCSQSSRSPINKAQLRELAAGTETVLLFPTKNLCRDQRENDKDQAQSGYVAQMG